jgi:calcineurin-like phosphoesterase family protein
MTRETFFTSDQHYGHGKIIQYCNRPFSSVAEMNETMRENHNKTVRISDDVYMVGDLAFHHTPEEIIKLAKSLNGRKTLILGNHDQHIPGFPGEQIFRILEFRGKLWGGFDPTLCHYPMMSWNKSFHGSFQLHGHTHGTIPFDSNTRRLDVGVDTNNFTPISWDEVKDKLSKVPTPKEQRELRKVWSGPLPPLPSLPIPINVDGL